MQQAANVKIRKGEGSQVRLFFPTRNSCFLPAISTKAHSTDLQKCKDFAYCFRRHMLARTDSASIFESLKLLRAACRGQQKKTAGNQTEGHENLPHGEYDTVRVNLVVSISDYLISFTDLLQKPDVVKCLQHAVMVVAKAKLSALGLNEEPHSINNIPEEGDSSGSEGSGGDVQQASVERKTSIPQRKKQGYQKRTASVLPDDRDRESDGDNKEEEERENEEDTGDDSDEGSDWEEDTRKCRRGNSSNQCFKYKTQAETTKIGKQLGVSKGVGPATKPDARGSGVVGKNRTHGPWGSSEHSGKAAKEAEGCSKVMTVISTISS
jgi:hypothetical protein